VPKPKVLVIAGEPVVAALLGMLLELEQFEPVFATPGERAEDALARVLPPLVILLDGDESLARSDLFFARAAKSRASVVVFTTPRSTPDARASALARGNPWFALPVERRALAQILTEAAVAG
jgi:CheY-like chemotaxis protein